jgi:acetyltransferase-like isoleucine patch superfamily enzyme
LKTALARIQNCLLRLKYPGALWGAGAHIQGLPRIWTLSTGQISVGKKVLLNSSPRGYHAGMSFPVTLIADRPNAVIEIGDDTRLHGCCIHAWSKIIIGKRCLLAAGSQVLDAHGHDSRLEYSLRRLNSADEPQPVWIGDDCWIGLNAIILKGVQLGTGSIVSAGSVLRAGTYPPYSLLAGNPARVVKTISADQLLTYSYHET